MMYTFGIIKGRDNLDAYCLKRWKEKPKFMETIAHCGEATIELFYEKSPTDDGYREYYLLHMKHPNGVWSDVNKMRHEAHESIRTGRATLIKV